MCQILELARGDNDEFTAGECPSPKHHPARNLRIRLAEAEAGFEMQMPGNRREPAGRRPFDRPPIIGEQEIRSQAAERKSATHQVVQHTPLDTSDRQDRDIEIAGNSLRGVEIVVQGDDRVAESLAKMINYANHAQWYAADPKTREYVQDVLATQGGTGDADRIRTYLYGGNSGLATMRRGQCLINSLLWRNV